MIVHPTLSDFARRAGALSILLVVLTTLWPLVVRPTLGLVFGNGDLLEIREHIATLRYDERQLPSLRSKLADAQRRLHTTQTLWGPASTAEVSAGMQIRLKQIVAVAGGAVRDTADLPWKSQHGFMHVEIRGDLVQSLPEFSKTLIALENSAPALVIEDLTIQSLQSGAPNMEPRLAIALTLSAYQANGS